MDKIVPVPEDYDVSLKHGFLFPDPLVELPEYFAAWNEIAQNLPNHILNKTVRNAVAQLPKLDHALLKSSREQRCAHVLLSMITMAYVWQDGDQGVCEILPEQLAVPYCGVSTALGLPPIIVHASFMLANWTLQDPNGPMNLGNVKSIVGLYPWDSSNWFAMVTWWVEVQFIPAIENIISSMESVRDNSAEKLNRSLQSIQQVIRDMKEAMGVMHEKLDSTAFYNNIRPFLSGWGGTSSPLPNGLIYEGVSTNPVKYSGGSAAQSSTIQSLDAVLGISHSEDKEDFLKSMRSYMPPKHAKFIDAIRKGPSVRQYVLDCNNGDLTKIYNETLKSMEDFRSYHIQIVTKYIIGPAHKSLPNDYQSVSDKGTGGTSILPFLKSLRDTTKDHLHTRNDNAYN